MFRKISITAILFLFTTATQASSFIADINTWVGDQLAASNTGFSTYVFLFLGGLAASLLPCVYPLYPITINILKSRGNTQNKSLHPVIYFTGIVSMYFIFGIIAGTTGGAFNEILRYPISNLLIAVILILLGLSAAELLLIPLFSGSNNSSEKKGKIGTYLMGLSAGLLSSACVGPVVVGILIGIASNTVQINLNSIFSAAIKLLFFGIGVGMPFLILGVMGAKLPKAGKWMKSVQMGFAILIIYFAYGYLEKALLDWDFSETQIIQIAIGSILFLLAVFKIQNNNLFPHEKMRKSLYIFTGTIGVLILFKSINPINNSVISSASTSATLTEQKGNLTWYLDKDAAYTEAKKSGKLVFLDFHGNWCSNCKAFQKMALENIALNQALQNAILYKIYDTSPAFKVYREDPRFPELKVGLPFFVITDADGNLIYTSNDYLKTDEIILFLSE